MLKLLKYELKLTSKFMLSLAGAVLIASLMFNLGLKNTLEHLVDTMNPNSAPFTSQLKITPLVFAGIIMFGAGISFFFYLAGRLKRELFEEDGYLTFSLPLTGYQVLGAKSLAAVLWGILQLGVVALSTYLFHRFFIWDIFRDWWTTGLQYAFTKEGLLFIGFLIVETLMGIMVVYLSILLSKVFFRPERGRWIWFLLAMVIAFANSQILKLALEILARPAQEADFALAHTLSYPLYTLNQNGLLTLGLLAVLSIVYFVVNGYLLDKRVEL